MYNIYVKYKKWPVAKKTCCWVLLFLAIVYMDCLPGQLFHVPYATVVTDRSGELLGARIATDGQWRFPPRASVPEKMEKCIIAFEDKHFYYHWGVDPVALCRACYQNLKQKKIVSGGSTLTMQTIRLSRNQPRTIFEKIVEAIWATRLEFRCSKGEILALYMSYAPFGGNVVGLDAAAWRYFGHAAEELSWAESATLAVLPNAPSMIHLSKGRNRLLEKRNGLLKRLRDDRTIDSDTYELAISEPLAKAPHDLPQAASCLVDYFYKTEKGKRIRSTLDAGIQQRIESILEQWNAEFIRSDIRNMAALVIDIPSNQVIAYCGNMSRDRRQNGNQVDIVQAPRSTGSILKPFLYAAMLKEGSLLPHMLLPDVPVNINGFTPENFNMQYEGAVPASEALARSLNVPAVNMLRQYGTAKFLKLLQQWGLHTLNRPASHYGLSLILGGGEATLWDVTNAYKRLVEAIYPSMALRKSQALLQIDGKEEKPDDVESFHDLGKEGDEAAAWAGASWLTLAALMEVNRPEEIDWKSISSMQRVAWKTGTSYGFRDAWSVGVTPRYAVGVWVGNATGEGKPELVGARAAAPVMFDIFNALPYVREGFKKPAEGLLEAEVCKHSGYLKGRFCEESDVTDVPLAAWHSATCPFHHLVNLTLDEKYRIYENVADNGTCVQKSWFTLPPVWEWYYKQHHPEYKPLPPFKGRTAEDYPVMQFIYPTMNAIIQLPKQMDGSKGFLTAEVAASNAKTTLFWHLDGSYLTETQDFHKISLQPSEGKHSLTVVDSDGNSISTSFQVN